MKLPKSFYKCIITISFIFPVFLLERSTHTIATIPSTCSLFFSNLCTSEFIVYFLCISLIAFPMCTITVLQTSLSKYVLITRRLLIEFHIHAVLFYFIAQSISAILCLLLIKLSKTNEYPMCILTMSRSKGFEDVVFNVFVLCTLFTTSMFYYLGTALIELLTLNHRIGGYAFGFDQIRTSMRIKFTLLILTHLLPYLILNPVLIIKTAKILNSYKMVLGIVFYCNVVSILAVITVLAVSWVYGGRVTKRRRPISVVAPAPPSHVTNK